MNDSVSKSKSSKHVELKVQDSGLVVPLVMFGVAGRHNRLSAASRMTWRKNKSWALRVTATLQRLLGLPLTLQPEYLRMYAHKAGWLMGIRVCSLIFLGAYC